MNKKAALELSINMIVIIVIAMAVLGLGLGFVRSQIKKIGETSTTVQEQIRQQILDDLRVGNKKLSFPTDRFILASGEVKDIAFGMQNLEAQDIWIAIVIQKFENGVWSDDLVPRTRQDDSFVWDNSQQKISRGGDKVFPIVHQAEKDKDTYMYQLIVRFWTQESQLGEEGSTYASKSFFVTVT